MIEKGIAMRRSQKVIVLVLFAAGLSACGGSSSTAPNPPAAPAPMAAAKIEDGFGANFGIAFRADPNSIAKDPVAGDIIPLDLTKDPVTI